MEQEARSVRVNFETKLNPQMEGLGDGPVKLGFAPLRAQATERKWKSGMESRVLLGMEEWNRGNREVNELQDEVYPIDFVGGATGVRKLRGIGGCIGAGCGLNGLFCHFTLTSDGCGSGGELAGVVLRVVEQCWGKLPCMKEVVTQPVTSISDASVRRTDETWGCGHFSNPVI